MKPTERPRLAAIIVVSAFAVLAVCCGRPKNEVVWDQNFPVIGSQSSPRAADLNQDGVLDIVMGAGKNEFQSCRQGILALNGKTGDVLWQQEAPDQVYGSATFCDITGDGIKDVFIGGRSPHLKALNGKTGAVIWAYKHTKYAGDSILKHARFNFGNNVLVPDQNGDGLEDLLTINGGNAGAAPNTEQDRYPGVLLLFDSRTGDVLAADTMPDGKETYMSPVCFAQPGGNDHTIIIGTGGETIDGHLYSATLEDLKKRNLQRARVIATEHGHGFIAPPSVADINQDGFYDVVAISHGSTVFAVDGKTGEALWTRRIAQTESSNSFAVGYFNDDRVPDFFTFVSRGQWPNSTGTRQVLLDGRDGQLLYEDSIGCTGYSSPVVYDLDGDGIDEAIISVNEFDCSVGFVGKPPKDLVNKVIAIDFAQKAITTIDSAVGFKNIFSTPWVGDLDGDGYLNLVYCKYYHRGDLLLFLGMNVRNRTLPVRVEKPVLWGEYMGARGEGVFVGEVRRGDER